MVNIVETDDLSIAPSDQHDHSYKMAYQLFQNAAIDLISNVKTTFSAVNIENETCVLTVNQKEYSNALVCSPYTMYVTYPLDEIKKISKSWIKFLVLLNTGMMFFICRLTKFNKVIQVNNNLNSLPHHSRKCIAALQLKTRCIAEKYPDHAIMYSRVNEKLHAELLEALIKNGYIVFPDRTAHIFFPDQFMKRSHTKRDMSILRKTEYDIVKHENLTSADAERIAELYRLLFFDKHSKKNPNYTAHYFAQAIAHHWHYFVVLKNKKGVIDAFVSWSVKDDIMLCGPLGYDPDVDRKMGLYRQLVALCLQHAQENRFIFNMGGGSSEFKLNRGSSETLDYTAVYYQHLPLYRRIPWKIFQFGFNVALKKIMRESKF